MGSSSGISARLGRATDPQLAVLLAALICAVKAPGLAIAPQNPDGAGLVMAALGGGVLPPPGFPLQAWFDKLFVLAPFANPSRNLALLSLLLHLPTLAAFFLSARCLSLSRKVAVFATVCFAFFPPVWEQSIQPDKYSLTLLVLAAPLWLLLHLLREGRGPSRRESAALGALFGIGLAQHLAVLALAPFALAVWLPRKERARASPLLALSLMLGVAAAAYGSLFLLTGPGAWPDWGKLRGLSDLWRLLTRSDLTRFLGGTAKPGETGYRALSFFAGLLPNAFHLLLLLPFAALPGLLRKRRLRAGGALLAAFLLSLAWLMRIEMIHEFHFVAGYFERYGVVAMLFLALLFGCGLEFVLGQTRGVLRAVLVSLAFVSALSLVPRYWSQVDASRDRTLDLVRDALGATLPAGAIYVEGSDFDLFYGMTAGRGVRFPLLDRDWFMERQALYTEPRLAAWLADETRAGRAPTLRAALDWSLKAGLPIYSTAPRRLQDHGGSLSRVGAFSVLRNAPAIVDDGAGNVAAALSYCQVLGRSELFVPETGHHYARYLWAILSDQFLAAGHSFLKSNRPELAEIAGSIAIDLAAGGPQPLLGSRCRALFEGSSKRIPSTPRPVPDRS